MFELVDVNLEKEMDNALHYVSENIIKTGHNPKPVLLHSFKVSMTLYSYNYPSEVVISGILHDLIEDTGITGNDIEKKYGKRIRKIVEAVSFNPNIENKLEQAKAMFKNCCDLGRDALLVKCADLLDNINFVHLVNDEKLRNNLLMKYNVFLEMSKNQIGEEVIYGLLQKKYNDISTKI